MQIRHYAWVIKHWLWLILFGTAICTGATYAISLHLRPVYQASALIQVNGTDSNNAYNNQALAVSYSLLITSDDCLQRVAQKMPGVSLSQLKNAVSDSPLDNTQIIEVRAEADNPQQAADIANEVVKVFIQFQVTKATTGLQSLADQLSKNLLSTKANIETAKVQLTTLQNSAASADKIAHQKDILNGYQADYNSLLANYQQIQLQKLQAGNILIQIQTAVPPDTPRSPHVMLNTIIAAAMGLLLMTVLALVLDWMDTTIKTSEDVAHLAMLKPLGSVPLSKRPLLFVGQPSTSIANDDAVEQAFIVMSTSFSALNKDKRTILVTGLRPGAGSSTIAANMAIALAQSGKRVLLVDANLPRPSLHEIFHCPNSRGLVNSLADVNRFHAGVVYSWLSQWTTYIPNLWLLPAGPIPGHPIAILRSSELRMLIGWLLGQSLNDRAIPPVVDMIIFDAPSLEGGADTAALASLTDGTVLVIEAGKERKEMLHKAVATLQQLCSPVLGVIVNRQTTRHRPYFHVDHPPQNTLSAGSSLLGDPIELALSTKPTLLPDSPPSPLQVMGNHQDSDAGQLARLPLEGGDGIAQQIDPPATPRPHRPLHLPTTPRPPEETRTNHAAYHRIRISK